MSERIIVNGRQRKIVYAQFTRSDRERHPELDNPEYLDYKEVKTGLSKDICSYGYQQITYLGNGVSSIQWLKKSDIEIVRQGFE